MGQKMPKPLHELNEEVARLKGTDLRNLSDGEVRERLRELCRDSYGVMGTTLSNDHSWIRARTKSPSEGWTHLRDCLYPWPPSGHYGRFHTRQESRFYAAGDLDTALSEVNADPGDYVQLVSCKFMPSAHAPIMTVGQYQIYHHSRQVQFQDQQLLANMRVFESWTTEFRMKHLVVDAFLADQFAWPDESRYRLTAAFASFWGPGTNGVAYPSTKTRGGLNIALNTETFDRHFVVQEVLVVKVLHFWGNFAEYEIVRSSREFDTDGRIRWNAEAGALTRPYANWRMIGNGQASK